MCICLYMYVQECIFRNIFVCAHLSVQPFTKNIIFQWTETRNFGGKTAIPAEAEGSGHQANSLGRKAAESFCCLPDEVGSQATKRELYQVVPLYLTLCPIWVPGHLHGLSVQKEHLRVLGWLSQQKCLHKKQYVLLLIFLDCVHFLTSESSRVFWVH